MNETTKNLTSVFLGVTMLMGIGVGTTFGAESATDSHNVVITVVERAMLDLSSTDDVTFTIDVIDGGYPGDRIKVIGSTNTDNKYLRYTSIVAGTGYTRKITVEIDDDVNIPAGTTLKVLPGAPSATGQGNRGTAVGTAIDLSTAESAQDVVTGIRSCSTGRAETNGVNLVYTLTIDNAADAVAVLVADEYTVDVTYTLTESSL